MLGAGYLLEEKKHSFCSKTGVKLLFEINSSTIVYLFCVVIFIWFSVGITSQVDCRIIKGALYVVYKFLSASFSILCFLSDNVRTVLLPGVNAAYFGF